jgi:hypothetical protein
MPCAPPVTSTVRPAISCMVVPRSVSSCQLSDNTDSDSLVGLPRTDSVFRVPAPASPDRFLVVSVIVRIFCDCRFAAPLEWPKLIDTWPTHVACRRGELAIIWIITDGAGELVL